MPDQVTKRVTKAKIARFLNVHTLGNDPKIQ